MNLLAIRGGINLGYITVGGGIKVLISVIKHGNLQFGAYLGAGRLQG
jgi:hypothetical protein